MTSGALHVRSTSSARKRAAAIAQGPQAHPDEHGQEGVSRIEQRSDLLISTLRSYVEAMGGKLSIIAEFPDRVPVILTGLAGMDNEPKGHRKL